MENEQQKQFFMQLALEEAKNAFQEGEVPIGAVLVKDGKVIAKAHNNREKSQLAAGHAEMLVIEKANELLNSWRLEQTTLYVTVEPCLMCAGAILQARIPNLVYGLDDLKFGAVSSLYQTLNDEKTNHSVDVSKGVFANESKEMMQSFFQRIRKQSK